MAGDEDEPCLEACLLMKRCIPKAGLALLPKSGHAINLEEPALFNQLLEDFFHQVRGRPLERARSACRAGLRSGGRAASRSSTRRSLQVSKLISRDLRVRAVAAPMRRPLTTSTGAVSVATLLLVDLEDERRNRRPRLPVFHLEGTISSRLAALVEAMGEMVKGDAVAPFEIEQKLRARYTLLGVHNIVLFAMAASTWRPGTRSARRSASRWCALLGGDAAAGARLQLEWPRHPGR